MVLAYEDSLTAAVATEPDWAATSVVDGHRPVGRDVESEECSIIYEMRT